MDDVDFGGLAAYDVYPNPLPDLFKGSQLVLAGRYSGNGDTLVTLEGTVNGKSRKLTYETRFPETASENEFIPRLWATRKVGYLLNKLRLSGPDQETIDQIVKLSIRYGIVTPYTSYLVDEPMPLGADAQQNLSNDAFRAAQAAPAPQASGAGAVNKAAEQGALSGAQVAPTLSESAAQKVQVVGSRTFVYSQDTWMDTQYDPKAMSPVKVAFLSADYYTLAARPDTAGR